MVRNANLCENCIDVHREEGAYFPMKRTAFLVLLCLCLMLGACFATAGAEGAIEISTKEQLKVLVDNVAADPNKYQGKTVKLLNDIDLGGDTWTPIDTFKGEFDGNGKTIRNFKMGYVTTADGNRYGFFRLLSSGAKVHDLTLQSVNAIVEAKGYYGTLACNNGEIGTTATEVKNIHIKDVNVTVASGDKTRFGGLFHWTTENVSNCTVENISVNAPNGVKYAGGFSAFADTRNHWWLSLENCAVKGFKLTAGKKDAQYIGGFVGYAQTGGMHQNLKNCSVTGLDFTINGIGDTMVSGFISIPGSYITATNCSTQGTINASQMTDSKSGVGGFFSDFGWYGTTDVTSKLTNCSADVTITSGGAMAGGFVAYAHITQDSPTDVDNKQFRFDNCTASGNVINPNGFAGGFVGVGDRGEYLNCTATGLVSGKIAGGFIGEVRDWKPTYPDKNVAAFQKNFGYDANQVKLSGCKAVGTVLGTEKAGGLIGNVGKSLNGTAAEGAAGELIVTNCTAAPAVIGAKKSTQVAPYLNSTADSKTTRMDKLSGKRTTANPTDGSKALAMDQNGNVTIPEGGADVQHTDDPELKWIPAGSIIHRDGSITLPGEEVADEVTAVMPPKTGVDSADRFIPMALLSLLCMAALVTLRRKERRS